MRRQAATALALMLALGLAPGKAGAADLAVGVDEARPVKLDRDAAAIVVGNPFIADAYVQDGRNLFVLGRTFGTTNVIAYDAEGKHVATLAVTVAGSRPREVTLRRGTSRQSFACAPSCERVLKPGDNKDEYSILAEQMKSKVDLSIAAAEPR